MKDSKHLYIDYFNLKEPPFKITPTTSYFYGGGKRGEILHALLYAINSGEGIMLLTGEVGSGKTMILRTLVDQLSEKTDIIYIANPSLSGSEILYNICEELGLQSEEKKPDTVRILQNHLIQRHQEGYRVVAFIDEAQAMPDESLEEIRLLSNLETSRDKLLQIVLFGQPELEEKLSKQHLRQLRERITVALKIKPFTKEDIKEYISTRLHAAGHDGKQLFTNDAYRIIFAVSKGISRRINVLADKTLLSAFARGSLIAEKIDAKMAARDVSYGKLLYRSEQNRLFSKFITIGCTVGCLLIITVFSFIYFGEQVTASFAEEPVADKPVQSKVVKKDTVIQNTIEIALNEIINAQEKQSELEVAVVIEEESEPVIQPDVEVVIVEESEPVIQPDVEVVIEEESEPVIQPDVEVVIVEEQPKVVSKKVESVKQQTKPVNIGKQMSQTIVQLQQQKEVALSGEQLALEISKHAEEHTDGPQVEGGQTEWQIVVKKKTTESLGIVENSQWDWMPASSYLRSRLNATQTWIKNNPDQQQYTSRLITVSQERAIFLEKFLRYFADYYPIRNVLVYPIQLKSGKKFVVNFGVYPSQSDAEVFINNIPRYFTGGEPYAQEISSIVKESQDLW